MSQTQPLVRIAHLSDLHFSVPSYNPLQLFSKRWLGNLNMLFSRKKDFNPDQLLPLIDLLKEKKATHVVITGDITTTSFKREFVLGQAFASKLKEAGFQAIIIPGNHDQYTRKAFKKKLFYDFFEGQFTAQTRYSLKEHSVTVSPLADHWWLVALDTAIATSLVSSEGLFSTNIEKHLEQILAAIPKQENIILINHFPFFHHDGPRKGLVRAEILKRIVMKYPNIKLYLHGHTHRQCIADLRGAKLPIILDPGSTSHNELGGFFLMDIFPSSCHLEVYHWKNSWQFTQDQQFNW